MHFQFAEIFGVAAALASLYAAHSKTMIPLRWAAIAANALAMVYSAMHGTWPTFALNAILLPTNAWRLHAMLRLIGDIDRAIKGDLNAEWLLPYARPKTFQAGEVLMARGDYATAAYYVAAGEVEIAELQPELRQRHPARRDRPVHAGRAPHHDGALHRPRCTPPCSTTTASRSCTSRTRSSASACCR